MSAKNSRETVSKFTKPLPIEVIQLPAVYPQNPISWLIAAISFVSQVITIRNKKIHVIFDEDDCSFKVTSKKDMDYLWDSGFYGKGSLSRSEPTWLLRAQKRILGVEEPKTTGEEIVRYRRQLRGEYKQERNKLLQLERQYKLENNEEKLKELESMRQKLSEQRDRISKAGPPPTPTQSTSEEPKKSRPEDEELIIDSRTLRNIEYLELTPCEVLFLVYMDAIEIDNSNNDNHPFTTIELLKYLVDMFGEVEPNNYLLIMYAVYFHYKSLGWCVKSDLKFSSDFVLYQRGPPFHHAAFAVTVLQNSSKEPFKNWTHFGSIYRVVSAVKKTMVLCYIDSPTQEEFSKVWDGLDKKDPEGLIKLLNLYTIQEMVYKRWTPSRTRM
ncbi:DEKNAAC100596 [Brettanomyces naardenensis]|uniref:tRNA-splicing endonuclease subunit Sen2 n=1 Tax=Brettanomyces naardenensis TaxID=13370 RepID=A0A448YFA7_BRENA|nr:DEKNAAC100596 [Brettanomyces naardenensis]